MKNNIPDDDKIRGGATIWARQTIDSEIFFWKPDKWFKMWFYIVNRVNHKDNKLFERGSAYIEYGEIALKTGATYGQIQSFIRWAKKMQMLSTHKSTRGNIITVCKYNVFQDFDNYVIQAPVKAKSKHNPSTIHAINKNDKNDKNDNISIVAKSDDWDFLEELEKLKNSNRREFKIIALYWKKKKWKFENKAQFSSALKRELRPAKDLVGYKGDQISKAIIHCEENYKEWTLETIHKAINKVINNTK
ncbi:MAG: hypothetical protein NUV97_02905 [archaeon]|nr:hypothetical protein [archaeon]MCR4343839.1 hypothetical protein [Candidatus Scalindua sp.]